MGAIGSTARSLATKSQTNLVWSVRPACFAPAKAGRAHGYCCVLAGRSLAAIGVFGCVRAVLDCLASLRPTERTQWELASFQRTRSGVKRRQGWRVSHRAQAEQCGCLARSEPVGDRGRASVRRTQRKCPLCDAGVLESWELHPNCPAGRRPIPARRGCYSQNEERSDESSKIFPR
jgi:hypothetical protein